MKKIVLFILSILIICNISIAEGNLLLNSGFETLNSKGLASNFYTDAYRDPSFISIFKIAQKAHTGKHSAYIRNAGLNDARFVQTRAVEPNSFYKLSGYIMASGIKEGKGANLSIEGVYTFTEPIYDTNGQWQYVELYGKTGKNQRELSVYARLGGYSGESAGEAYFDDISLEKIDYVPQDYSNWYREVQDAKPELKTESGNKLNRNAIILALSVYLIIVVFAIKFLRNVKLKQANIYIFLVLLVAFVLRVILAISIQGHSIDMGCFMGWGNQIYAHGIGEFYSKTNFCDYPPAYMLVLYINTFIIKTFGITDRGVWLTIKLVPILADIFTILLIYKIAYKKGQNALLISVLYAFNPLIIITGSVWGQIDSVFALLIVLACYSLLQNRIDIAIPIYTLSCLVKPQGLVFGPIALVYMINILRHNILWKRLAIGILLSIIVFAVIVVPFTPSGQGIDWIVKKYTDTLSSYEFATINTSNIFYLMNANWKPQSNSISILFAIIWTTVLLLASVYILLKHKLSFTQIKKISKPTLAGLLLLVYAIAFIAVYVSDNSYLAFSTLNIIAILLTAGVLVFVLNKDRIAYILALALLCMYCLTVRMHERYLYTSIALFFIDYAYSKNIKSLIMGLLSSLAVYINVAIVLDNTIVLGVERGHLNNDTQMLANILSMYNCIIMWLGLYFCFTEEIKITSKSSASMSLAEKHLHFNKHIFIDRIDITIMLGIMLVYSLFGFYKLGSTTNPQTMFTSSASGETVVFELEKECDFNILYYGGINYNSVHFSTSNDNITYGEEYPAELNQGQIFKWNYLCKEVQNGESKSYFTHNPILLHGKYIRLSMDEAGVNLGEIIVREPSTDGVVGKRINIKAISHEGQDSDFSRTPKEYLYDEQNSLSGEPSYYNSTYFDEIYHARTGYEFLHNIRPYESSHPPLGKLFMSLGIMLFGMTPFGYRFFGVLVGVLMLPVLYISSKYLFNNRKLATSASIIFALDLMHLAQTRIATIDSYPVLFIMLSYMFMLKYIRLNHFAISLNKTFTPLLLCGICFGLSVASKWIGLYAGVGLAIMFFTSQYMQIQAGVFAKKHLTSNSTSVEREAADSYMYRFVQTCAHCVFYFIIIPCIIYYICYIPYFASTGGITLNKLLSEQQGMLNYHSSPGLGMDHPYYSPWWQWPFILKPMWYSLSYYEPKGLSQTIYCMGNPAIYYIGALAIIVTILIFVYKLFSKNKEGIFIPYAVTIGFISQYLPWVLVPRGTYMYHYFASVPFIILATMYIFYLLYTKLGAYKKLINILLIVFILISFAMFIGFYPYASGIMVSNKWLDAMKWFKGITY